jgi:hypothetical protein
MFIFDNCNAIFRSCIDFSVNLIQHGMWPSKVPQASHLDFDGIRFEYRVGR